MAVIEITSEEQFTELTSQDSDALIALYFHTSWAEPCKAMNSAFSTIARSTPSLLFLSINADDLPEISELFGVEAVPYSILIRNSTILKELSGADPKELIAALDQFTNDSATKSASAAQPSAPSNPVPASDPQQESKEALDERLKKLTSAAPIMLFMKGSPSAPECGFSRQLVAILREHQVRFGFFDILKDDAVRQGLKEFSDWPTFPQLYIKGEFQGGLDIIKELVEEDENFFKTASAE